MPYAQLPRHGDVLHDCHAEVLVRRALRAWLLERLVLEYKSQTEEVDGLPRLFTPTMTHDHAPVRWRLTDQVHIHLYISTPPCGEASSCLLHARNAMQDERTGYTPQTATHAAGSLLRGRETSSTQGMLLRTKPGRRDSPPAISMSCSDKVRLWNSLGMQGALLSQWLEPLFYTSIVLSRSPGMDATYAAACTSALAGLGARARRCTVHLVDQPFPSGREQVEERVAASLHIPQSSEKWADVEPVPGAGGTSLFSPSNCLAPWEPHGEYLGRCKNGRVDQAQR